IKDSRDPSQGSLCNRDPCLGNLGSKDPGLGNLGSKDPGLGNLGSKDPGLGNLGSKDPGLGNLGSKDPGLHNRDNQDPGLRNRDNQDPGLGNQDPGLRNRGNQDPGLHNLDNQDPGLGNRGSRDRLGNRGSRGRLGNRDLPGSTPRALTVPFNYPIQGGWPPMKMLTIEATIKTNIDKFGIDVCAGHDTAFHFNVRFKEDGHQQAIVRNSKFNNVWGPEERAIPNFPFKKGEKFELLILGEPHQYRVAVNKQHFTQFAHRSKNLSQVTNVNIYGDITLHKMVMM
ncbi:galectin-3, partial [Amblyraja radiata]|uniref:galectin-3 n=1 Tax=Amblyraja radiata TaxID=386614 RepID=UPI0014039EE0